MSIAIPKIQTANVILRLYDKYILQLRDDRPDIAAHGQWSLFGGGINLGETPMEAVKREIFEELLIRPDEFKFLWHTDYYYDFVNDNVRTWFFASNVENVWGNHQLKEGKAVDVFCFHDIKDLNIPDVIMETLNKYHLKEVSS